MKIVVGGNIFTRWHSPRNLNDVTRRWRLRGCVANTLQTARVQRTISSYCTWWRARARAHVCIRMRNTQNDNAITSLGQLEFPYKGKLAVSSVTHAATPKRMTSCALRWLRNVAWESYWTRLRYWTKAWLEKRLIMMLVKSRSIYVRPNGRCLKWYRRYPCTHQSCAARVKPSRDPLTHT